MSIASVFKAGSYAQKSLLRSDYLLDYFEHRHLSQNHIIILSREWEPSLMLNEVITLVSTAGEVTLNQCNGFI